MKILLTTPDYPPKLGGLSTLCVHLEESLRQSACEVEVFVWDHFDKISSVDPSLLESVDWIVNLHFNFGLKHPHFQHKMINFLHGSEALITSPNWVRRWFKRIFKFKYLNILRRAKYNIFISQATQQKVYQRGLESDYSRDLVFHNCIDTTQHQMKYLNIENGPLIFTFIARNVPHKNFEGTKNFLLKIKSLTGREIILHTSGPEYFKNCGLKIVATGKTNQERDQSYREAHFNILFSLDHSMNGFYEGFGLTVLEAALWGTPSLVLNTGGLAEAVHHQKTGYVFQQLSDEEMKNWCFSLRNDSYQLMAKNAYEHTREEHSLDSYQRLFRSLL